VAQLRAHGIRTLVDVRLRPDRAAMGSYVLAKDAARGIRGLVAPAGITYVSLVELGNPFLGCPDWQARYQRLLDAAGDLLTERLAGVTEPFCLMCAERAPADCHRAQVAAHLAARGRVVEHIP
jgi:hypothetical protein